MKVGPKLKADSVSNIKFLLIESKAFLKSIATIKPWIFSLSVNSKRGAFVTYSVYSKKKEQAEKVMMYLFPGNKNLMARIN